MRPLFFSVITSRGVATGGVWGVSHPPKSFKNREISGKLRENSGKLKENSGKLRENSGKLRENSGKLRENSGTSGNICGC